MLLTDCKFVNYQFECLHLYKRTKWLGENIETLQLLLNYIKNNRNSSLHSYYDKYQNMLIKKTNQFYGLYGVF